MRSYPNPLPLCYPPSYPSGEPRFPLAPIPPTLAAPGRSPLFPFNNASLYTQLVNLFFSATLRATQCPGPFQAAQATLRLGWLAGAYFREESFLTCLTVFDFRTAYLCYVPTYTFFRLPEVASPMSFRQEKKPSAQFGSTFSPIDIHVVFRYQLVDVKKEPYRRMSSW